MVVLNKIYTRTGDTGETGLSDGSRVGKSSPRVAAYGTVDEANAVIGVARLHVGSAKLRHDPTLSLDDLLSRIQNDLFDVGADLATPLKDKYEYEPLRVVDTQVNWLEEHIDAFTAQLEPLRSFILPAGTAFSAHMHQARTVVRRAERDVVHLAAQEAINEAALKYLNRLSDLCFVLARVGNDGGLADVLWVPGAHR